MKRTKADILRLIAELAEDKNTMQAVAQKNAKAWRRIQAGAVDELDYMALAFTMHNIYGIVENACVRITRFFENNLTSETWHRDVLERMKLEIPGVRKAFFSREDFLLFDELRAFRHVFRNLYSRALNIDRLNMLQKNTEKGIAIFYNAVDNYNDFLHSLQSELKE